jgi:hypothetical protein
VFASAAARNAAITSPQEGQYCYLKDTNSTEYYDGAAWVSGVEGDISGVTAGVGISGGGTSGTVTVTNSMATTITTKGDLVPGTGSGTFSRLAVGANDTMLVGDSTAGTGLAYKSAATLYPWTTWSPTYTNFTIGNGVVTARYQQIGKTINVYWKLVWGTTTSFTAYPLISYPATAAQGNYFMGASYLLDNSASAVYTGFVYAELGKASFQPLTQITNATYSTPQFFTANTVPYTWTTNDEMICNFTYEAA